MFLVYLILQMFHLKILTRTELLSSSLFHVMNGSQRCELHKNLSRYLNLLHYNINDSTIQLQWLHLQTVWSIFYIINSVISICEYPGGITRNTPFFKYILVIDQIRRHVNKLPNFLALKGFYTL